MKKNKKQLSAREIHKSKVMRRMTTKSFLKKLEGKDYDLVEFITKLFLTAYTGENTKTPAIVRLELDNLKIDKYKLSDLKFEAQRIAINNYLKEKILIFAGLTGDNVIDVLTVLNNTSTPVEYISGLNNTLLPFLKENDIVLDFHQS
jgi:hypothetical protein